MINAKAAINKGIKMELTRDQPGYYTDMLKVLAAIDNTPSTKKLTYPNIESARKNKVKFTNMIFSIGSDEIYCISVEIRNNVKTLVFNGFELPVSEYKKPVSIIVNKDISGYIAKPKHSGNYKHCEGGGWYSWANLYELNGKYYTDAY